MNNKIDKIFDESIEIISESKKLVPSIVESVNLIRESLINGGKIIAFGNGGSSSDAQHFVAEFIGRFEKERKSIPAISLTADSSIITAVGNDYGFERIFERQCEGLLNKNDIVIAISTSGNSQNVLNGVRIAKKMNIKTIGLIGKDGGALGKMVDVPIIIPSYSTPRIQEAHRIIYHIICEMIEKTIRYD